MWREPDVEGRAVSKDITLADLATSAGSSTSEAASAAADAADESTGEWVLELYERLEDDGMLQAILFGPDALERPDGADVPADVDGAHAAAQGGHVDAELVADALEDVKKTVGDLRISQLVELTRENPDLVDRLLEDHLEDATDEQPAPEDLEDED